jgi:hypothetical protein
MQKPCSDNATQCRGIAKQFRHNAKRENLIEIVLKTNYLNQKL